MSIPRLDGKSLPVIALVATPATVVLMDSVFKSTNTVQLLSELLENWKMRDGLEKVQLSGALNHLHFWFSAQSFKFYY